MFYHSFFFFFFLNIFKPPNQVGCCPGGGPGGLCPARPSAAPCQPPSLGPSPKLGLVPEEPPPRCCCTSFQQQSHPQLPSEATRRPRPRATPRGPPWRLLKHAQSSRVSTRHPKHPSGQTKISPRPGLLHGRPGAPGPRTLGHGAQVRCSKAPQRCRPQPSAMKGLVSWHEI